MRHLANTSLLDAKYFCPTALEKLVSGKHGAEKPGKQSLGERNSKSIKELVFEVYHLLTFMI